MLQQIFLGFLGLCSGFIIAGGLVGLLIGLSIVPRYAGITHTADHMMLYEDITLLGTELGNLFYLFHWKIPLGTPFCSCMYSFPESFSEDGSWHLQKWQTSFPSLHAGSVSSADFPLQSCALHSERLSAR